MSGYYLTAEPVGICSCHTCTCEGCAACDEGDLPTSNNPTTSDPWSIQ